MQETINYESICCANCGVMFALSSQMFQHRREDGGGFTCPNGHSNVFGQGKEEREKLKKIIIAANSSREYWQTQSEQQDRQISNLRGQITKLKNKYT